MPTHKDFPDSYFEDPEEWRHRRTTPAPRVVRSRPAQRLAPHAGSSGPPRKLAPALIVLVVALVVGGPIRNDLLSRGGTTPAVGGTLAVGTPLPGGGRPPDLVATTSWGIDSTVSIRSASPAPLSIYLSGGPGQPLKGWHTLYVGDSVSQSVITGHRYGYCFVQAAADGYAATRGCGSMSVHQTLNGVQLPDGAAGTALFTFVKN